MKKEREPLTTLTPDDIMPANEVIKDHIRRVMIDSNVRIAYMDRDLRYLWASPSYATGFNRTLKQIIGRSHLDIYPDHEHYNLLQEAINTGQKLTLRDISFGPSDKQSESIRYWDLTAIPVTDEFNDILGVGLVILETTERKNNERKLERAAAEWQQTFDSVPDLIFILDTDFRIIRANLPFARALNCKPEDMIGKTCYELVHDTKDPWPHCPLLRSSDSIATETIEAFEPKIGLYVEVNISPVFNEHGKLTGHVHIARDITRRKKIEKSLYESESRYRIVSENIEGGVIIYENNQGVYANTHASEILGYSHQEILNKQPIDYVAPDQQHKFLKLVERKTASGTKPARFNSWLIRKNGEKRYVHINYCPVIEKNRPPRYFVIFYDVTRLKLSDIRLKAAYQKEVLLHQELEREIKKRTGFAHALVHELKTPLTPIMTSSEILTRELPTDSVLSRLARNVHWGAIDLYRRTNELLQLATIEVGTFQVTPVLIDILKTIQDVVGFMEPLAHLKKQILISRIPESLPNIQVDDGRLRQVLMNLIGNALKYSPANSEITVTTSQKKDRIVIEVRDNGPGISKESKKHLFDPYFRIESNPEDVGGLGLGLFISKKIIELHGGEITVKTSPGKGSAFSFYLPFQRENGGNPYENSRN